MASRCVSGVPCPRGGAEGEDQRAESICHEALVHQLETGQRAGIADTLEIAALAAAQESYVEASRLFAAAEALRADTGYERWPLYRAAYEADLGSNQAVLGRGTPDAYDRSR